jgi:hypothetical protein
MILYRVAPRNVALSAGNDAWFASLESAERHRRKMARWSACDVAIAIERIEIADGRRKMTLLAALNRWPTLAVRREIVEEGNG